VNKKCESRLLLNNVKLENKNTNLESSKETKSVNEPTPYKLLKLESSENSNSTFSEMSDSVTTKSESCDFSGKIENDSEMKDLNEVSKTSCNGNIVPTSKHESAINQQTNSNSNIFLQNPSSNKLSELCNLSTVKSEPSEDSKLIIPQAHSSPLITPYSSAPSPFHMFFNSFSNQQNNLSPVSTSSPLPAHQHPKSSTLSSTDSKSSFLSIDTLLKKEKEPSKGLQSPSLFPAPDQMTKTLDEQKPWFSILPRMPCDDLSVAQVTSQMGMPPSPFNALPFFSPFSVGAFPIQNQTFAAFQMGQFSDSNQESSNEIKNNFKVSESDNSFKVPNTPGTEPSTPRTEPNTLSMFDQEEINTYDEAQPIPEGLLFKIFLLVIYTFFPLISTRDIFSINKLTLILKITGQCGIKPFMMLPIKTIMLVNYWSMWHQTLYDVANKNNNVS
jgi:hypothetical protein